jgi:pSer/pThr/pTyr-binding forkhead associated (FHA) protein
MSELQQSTFIISREDRAEDPKTVVADGLRIGRLPDSDVWLNHPQVSRLHAGINRVDDDFYLIDLSGSSPILLNGRVVSFNEIAAIVHGDEIQIGPFFLRVERLGERLGVRVSSEYTVKVGDREPVPKHGSQQKQIKMDSGALRAPTGSLDLAAPGKAQDRTAGAAELLNALQVFWAKRTRDKAGRPSPLHPRRPPRLGKVRFNWTPTRDLVRPWPFAIFIWAVIVVATFSVLAVYAHKNAFAPEAISDPHTRKSFAMTPPIATRVNGNSCTSCHALGISVSNKDKMNANCEACHHTDSFIATVIPEHRAAGITCISCHAEHHGASFRPLNSALQSCVKCHTDQNKTTYNGKTVHTPHGGTYGYPVTNGAWVWKGLDAEELAQKPELVAFLRKNRADQTHPDEWRNAQFHGIHLNNIGVVLGVDGTTNEEGNKVLSCSSCHRTGYMGASIDRLFPRTTCGKCHNAQVFNEPGAQSRADTVSCTSCHVQHVKDKHWAASLRVARTQVAQ